jgi:Carboxypeptidase regulatory-like domain
MLYKVIFVATCLATALGFPLWSAQERNGSESELRTVQGTVLTAGKASPGPAVVYLYDDRTQSVRTYFTDKAGHYHFCGLNPFDDYQIYAQRSRMTSKTYSISTQNDRKDFVFNLKISQRE